MLEQRKNRIFLIIAFTLFIVITVAIYLIRSTVIQGFLFRLYFIPVILVAVVFGVKGAVIVSLSGSLLYAPDYMLFIGKLSEDIWQFYIRIISFNALSITFGFFIDRWKIERNKFIESNTSLVKANEELKELIIIKETLENQERLAALGTVASGIAHELKNPLSVIKTAISSVSKELQNNSELVEIKEIINEEIQKADSVINSVLNIARDKELFIDKFDINLMITGVIRLMKQVYSKKKINVIFENDDIILIESDEQKLSRVIFNVINNSIDAVENIENPEIKITTNIDDNTVFISITDNGTGIEKQSTTQIFTPFFTTKKHGTGLGLSISKKIIDELGGKINFTSNNKLTEFIIELPVNTTGSYKNEIRN